MDNSKRRERRLEVGHKRRFAGGKPGKPARPAKSDDKAGKPTKTSGGNRPSAKPPTRPSTSPSKPSGARPAARSQSTTRVKPGLRALNRQAKNVARPMPQPPTRRPVARGGSIGGASARTLSQELQADVTRLNAEYERLEKQAQLSTIYDDIGKFDSKLVEYPLAVDGLRARGYVHSGQLEDQIEALDDKWDDVRPRVESALQQQVRRLDTQLDEAERKVNQMTNAVGIKGAETAVNGLSRQISAAASAVEGLYQGLETELDQIGYRLNSMSRMLDLYEGAPEIRLYEAEGPLLAVEAEWEQDGEDGPGGYLYLTDQRFVFEQREEVVTKRKFGLFKSESEKIQKVLLEVRTHEIDQVSHKEEGGFLGMGKNDILELVFADTAPLTRARFHLKGQDSSAWATMIKRVQTGEINADRAEEYLEEMTLAEAATASFPTECSNCFAAVEPPPRGATSLTCGFCGTVMTPQVAD